MLTTEERAERLATIHAELQDGVRALTSSDDWQRALAFAARFHRYSFGNVLLIRLQRPDATNVAGFQRWRELGRCVRKGERGIAILAPVVTRIDPKPEADAENEPQRIVRHFRVAHVFDVSQTDGDELPRTTFAERLTTGADAERTLYATLADDLRRDGWTVEAVPGAALGTANGMTEYPSRTVKVRDDLAPTQALKTLAHERAHTLLHGAVPQSRDLIECEAESAAYIVLSALGIDAGAYSFGYVASWSAGDARLVQEAGRNAMRAAERMLDTLAA